MRYDVMYVSLIRTKAVRNKWLTV